MDTKVLALGQEGSIVRYALPGKPYGIQASLIRARQFHPVRVAEPGSAFGIEKIYWHRGHNRKRRTGFRFKIRF